MLHHGTEHFLHSFLFDLSPWCAPDTCGGKSPTGTTWDTGLQCYECHVHVSNEHVDVVNKQNHISDSEKFQLSECDQDRGDVTRKCVWGVRCVCRGVLDVFSLIHRHSFYFPSKSFVQLAPVLPSYADTRV